MKPHICLMAAISVAGAALPGRVLHAATNLPGPTYVIPVEGMIERGLVYVVRRGVTEAVRTKAGAVVFDMNTLGGRVDAAKDIVGEIVRIIQHADIPTYTYVNPEAISAGALIAMATDHIYMAPASSIGAATPLLSSPMGGAQEVPEAVEEKMTSYVDSLMRSAAQSSGHDVELARAMVRRDIEYKIGDEIISPKGTLLTLTNVEAERMVGEGDDRRRLLSEGTVHSLEEVLKLIGRDGTEIRRIEVSWAERTARLIEVAGFLFLLGGLAGLYLEMKTPGFGVPGIVGILCLAIFFWGHNIAGLAGMEEMALFLAGLVLLAVEIFAIPGFGVTGIAGIVCIVASLGMAMVEHYPGASWSAIPIDHIKTAIVNLGIALTGSFAAMMILARYLPQAQIFQRIMLASDVGSKAGFSASCRTDELLGAAGAAVTPLRPSGIGIFGDKRVNVVTRGDFIEQGAPIVVAETHGNRIVVEPHDNDGAA